MVAAVFDPPPLVVGFVPDFPLSDFALSDFALSDFAPFDFAPFDAPASDFAAGLASVPDLPSPAGFGPEPPDSLLDPALAPVAPESDDADADPPASAEALASLRLSVR